MNLEKEPDYETVLQALLEKTKQGKVAWQETAKEDTFVAAAKGEQTFEITYIDPSRTAGGVVIGAGAPYAVLTVKDREGKLLFETPSDGLATALELFRAARRVALRVDEKIESTLELIDQL